MMNILFLLADRLLVSPFGKAVYLFVEFSFFNLVHRLYEIAVASLYPFSFKLKLIQPLGNVFLCLSV